MRGGAWLLGVLLAGGALLGADLDEVKQRGVLRHLGVPYANFVSGAGDGLDVDLMKLFAASLGVKYEYVPTDWGTVVQDLVGRKVKVTKGVPELLEETPVKGDLVANGFTILPWRQQVVAFATPTFPSQIWLVARADSKLKPIKPTGTIGKDIAATRALLKGKGVLTLEKTCLDPGLYDLEAAGGTVQRFEGKLNEVAPAVINKDAELTILDVPDALVALEKFKAKLKILGPISEKQQMAVAFPKDSPKLLEAYNAFIAKTMKDGTYFKLVKKYYPTVPRYFPEFFKNLK